ncbi:hypothetical protein VYU27_006534 [Nannochloropsis oceanica]
MYNNDEDEGGWSKAPTRGGAQHKSKPQQNQPKRPNASRGPTFAPSLKHYNSSSSSSSHATSSPSFSSPNPHYPSSRGRAQQSKAKTNLNAASASRVPPAAPTNSQGEKIFIPSCRASRIKQPARRKDWMRGLNGDDSSDDSLIHSSSDEDEDRDLVHLTEQLCMPVIDVDGKQDVNPCFADNLDQIIKLNIACPLSRTGLTGLVNSGIMCGEDRDDIEGDAELCKGNTQGFNSWEAMAAHARSFQDIYHTCICRYLEVKKGVAPLRRQENATSAITPSTAAPTDLEALYRSSSFPTRLKLANPPLVELTGLNQRQCNKAEILQYMVNALLEIQDASDGGCLVLSIHPKFGNGGKFMKRAAVEFRTSNKGRAAAHCILTRLSNSKILHPIHDADAMRASYPRLYKKLHDD